MFRSRMVLSIVLGVILVGGCTVALAGNFKPGAEPDGFRGIKWGTPFSDLQNNMTFQFTDPSFGGVNKYVKIGDELTIGAAKLDKILYNFWQNKFCSVTISAKGYVNFSNLKQALFEKFGEGFKSNQFMERYAWIGERTFILLDYNEISKEVSLHMFSQDISAEQKAYDKQKAKEGAGKGF